MTAKAVASKGVCFVEADAPRNERKVEHKLMDVSVIAICAASGDRHIMARILVVSGVA